MKLKIYLVRMYTFWIQCIVFNEGARKVDFDLSECVHGCRNPLVSHKVLVKPNTVFLRKLSPVHILSIIIIMNL